MNGNEVLLIGIAIVFLPVLIILFFIMPNDSNCNSCRSQLSMYRQHTYHWKIDGKEKEICKKCYNRKAKPKMPRMPRIRS
jgi:hypothetical protein